MALAVRQALKPFRLSLPIHRYPLQTRCFLNKRDLFSDSPIYATLAKRFSSTPSPTRQQDAKTTPGRESFVDIHDIGPIDPNSYDVLITDVDNALLYSEIAKAAGVAFLEEASKEKAEEVAEIVHGFIYGRNFRQIFPCVLGTASTARWVFFLVDTGAPLTYISAHVANAFGLDVDADYPGPWDTKIAGHRHSVHLSPKDSHFAEINILGGDFCTMNQVCPWIKNSNNRKVTFYLGGKWKVVSIE